LTFPNDKMFRHAHSFIDRLSYLDPMTLRRGGEGWLLFGAPNSIKIN
jgi:hypothetical protein